jgi:hypothetical protein
MTRVIVAQQWGPWSHCQSTLLRNSGIRGNGWNTLLRNTLTKVIVGSHCCATITSDQISAETLLRNNGNPSICWDTLHSDLRTLLEHIVAQQ